MRLFYKIENEIISQRVRPEIRYVVARNGIQNKLGIPPGEVDLVYSILMEQLQKYGEPVQLETTDRSRLTLEEELRIYNGDSINIFSAWIDATEMFSEMKTFEMEYLSAEWKKTNICCRCLGKGISSSPIETENKNCINCNGSGKIDYDITHLSRAPIIKVFKNDAITFT